MEPKKISLETGYGHVQNKDISDPYDVASTMEK